MVKRREKLSVDKRELIIRLHRKGKKQEEIAGIVKCWSAPLIVHR